jgi:ubiquinone/menaquinone biosynthesis C-methylase UbiE
VLSQFTDFEDKLLLEAGVGSGRNAKPLLEKIKACLVGLDLSRDMLKRARNKLFSHRRHFDLILADAEHLPFLAAAFEAVLCMSTMHYFADQEKA